MLNKPTLNKKFISEFVPIFRKEDIIKTKFHRKLSKSRDRAKFKSSPRDISSIENKLIINYQVIETSESKTSRRLKMVSSPPSTHRRGISGKLTSTGLQYNSDLM